MRSIACLAGGALLWASLITPVGAQDSRYSTWGGGSDLDALFERLNALIDGAERARAADPVFLRDLRAAIADYDRTAAPRYDDSDHGDSTSLGQVSELFFDDFRDGDFTRNPFWKVVRGEFTVDPRLGLRTVVDAGGTGSTGSGRTDSDNLAATLLDTLLGKQDGGTKSRQADRGPAEIFLDQRISNAFDLRLDIVSQERNGRFAVDLYQGTRRDAGYRLIYFPGAVPSLELARFGRRGEVVIDSLRERLSLEDGFRHRIELTRSTGRAMVVKVDGRVVMNVIDRTFSDPFDGVALTNEGGDYAVREISLSGTR